jgi:predicted Zn-dependent peptidase
MQLPVHLATLPNGLRVATIPMPQVESVSVGLWIGVGGRHEPARHCGISHFIEHLTFKGTPTRSAAAIARAVESRGGYLDAYTQEELTCFHARIAAEHLPETLALLADLYRHPRFAEADVRRERQVIAEEIAMYRDQPSHLAEDLLMEALWARHPLGRALTGTEATLARLEAGVLRAFHRRHYVPRASVLVLAGAVESAAVLALTRRHFSGGRTALPPPPLAASPRVARHPVLLRAHASEQTQLALGFRAFGRRDPRRVALKLASIILGENMSSRLFRKVREQRGWAYSISSSSVHFSDTGFLAVDAGLDGERTLDGLALIVQELARLARETPSRAEWRAARDYAIGQLRLGLESPSSQMNWVGEPLLLSGRWWQPGEAERRLNEVSPEAIRDVMRAVLRLRRASLVLVGRAAGTLTEPALQALLARHLPG